MRLAVTTAEDLGLILRAVRKDGRVPLEDLAQTAGVSRQTATNVERGRAKVSTLLAFLQELGVPVTVEIPQSAAVRFERLKKRGRA